MSKDDIAFTSIRRSNLYSTPFLTLALTSLDALHAGARGRITYYAKISESYPRSKPRGIVRRQRIGGEDETYDEALTRNLRWEPTENLRLYELGQIEVDHVEISEQEASRFIDEVAHGASCPDGAADPAGSRLPHPLRVDGPWG